MGIIIKPLVTEKMTAITDKSNNRFGFIVRPEANKLEIKNEVEALYNVTVVDVNTIRYAGKNKSRYTRAGIINGRTNAYKKAVVTLKEGDTDHKAGDHAVEGQAVVKALADQLFEILTGDGGNFLVQFNVDDAAVFHSNANHNATILLLC